MIRSTYNIMWNKVTQNGELPGKLTTLEEHPLDHAKVRTSNRGRSGGPDKIANFFFH
jgi:hypothetical protein